MTGQMSYYQGGFAGGLNVRGMPLIQTHPGRVFWLSNNTTNLETGVKPGSNGNDGQYNSPFSTLTFAVTQCKAGRGDIIMVKPGHAETLATAGAISLGVAGVAIIGLGYGNSRPTITMNAAAATILVAASNMVIQNFLFLSTFAAVATVFNVATTVVAKDFTIDNCEFRDTSTTLNIVKCFLMSGTTANAVDGLTFTNNKVYSIMATPTAVTTAVVTAAAMARVTISNNTVIREAALNNTAVLYAAGANNITDLIMSGNKTVTPNTGTTAGEMMSGGSTTSSGFITDNYSWHLAATGLLTPVSTKLAFAQNFCSITGAADKQATENPLKV